MFPKWRFLHQLTGSTIHMGKRLFWVFCVLASCAGSSAAMSLGPANGAAWVGRPLDLSVPAALDARDRSIDLADLCLEVDVAYGDRRLPRGRVQVSLEKPVTANAQSLLIRVRSTEIIDEPFVGMNVKMGCEQKLQRQYVVLADLVPEPTRTALPVLAEAPGDLGAAQNSLPSAAQIDPSRLTAPAAASAGNLALLPPDSATRSPLSEGERAATSERSPAAPSAAVTPSPVRPASAEARPVKSAVARAAVPRRTPTTRNPSGGRARLSLEPLAAIEAPPQSPQVQPSSELVSTPSTDPRERAAAAALLLGLSADPADLLREAEKLKALEAAVQGLQAQAAKDRLGMQNLERELSDARHERYVLTAVSLLALLALAGVMWRGRRTQEAPWWGNAGQSAEVSPTPQPDARYAEVDPIDEPVEATDPAPQSLQWPKRAEMTNAPLQADGGIQGAPKTSAQASQAFQSVQAGRATPAPALVSATQPSPSEASPSALLASSVYAAGDTAEDSSGPQLAEELIDVRQKADFFVSLGRHEHAVEALRSYLSPDLYTNPRGYVELFQLYHSLDRAEDYEALRKTFKSRFDADVAPFALYDSQAMADQIERISQTAQAPRAMNEAPLADSPDDTDAPDKPAASGAVLLDFDLDPLPQPSPPSKKNPSTKEPDGNFFAQSDIRWN
jgi:pilus assembly protein FimV